VRRLEGPKQRFTVKQQFVGHVSLQGHISSKRGLAKVGNEAKPWKYSEIML
jgi:hypothetical protein